MLRAPKRTSIIQIGKEVFLCLSIICFPQEKSGTTRPTADKPAGNSTTAPKIFNLSDTFSRNRRRSGQIIIKRWKPDIKKHSILYCPEISGGKESGLSNSPPDTQRAVMWMWGSIHLSRILKPQASNYYRTNSDINQDASLHLSVSEHGFAAFSRRIAHMTAGFTGGTPSAVICVNF